VNDHAITAADEQPHEHGGEIGWEEQLVFEAADERNGFTVSARMTHRPGDRSADAELKISLPGGEIAQSLHRAQNCKRAELTVGRLVIVVEEPLQRWRVGCKDVALVLPAGEQRGVATQIDVSLEFTALGAPAGAAERKTEVDAQKFLSVTSKGSFTQPVGATGRVKAGTNEITFAGAGIRTRQWGQSRTG